MRKFSKVIVLAVVAGLLIIGGTAVFAQEDEAVEPQPFVETVPKPQPGPRSDRLDQGMGCGNGRFLEHREQMNEIIADALGITVEELQAAQADGKNLPALAEELGVDITVVQEALKIARVEALEQAVEDGTITQEEADAVLERLDQKELLHQIINPEIIKEAVAEALGITVEELDAAREEKRLPELLEELDMDISDLQAAREAAKEAAVQQAIDDGLITQEQADDILNFERRPFGRHSRGFHGGPHSGLRGQGRFQGNGVSIPFNSTTAPALDA